jgi:hypothetical protein
VISGFFPKTLCHFLDKNIGIFLDFVSIVNWTNFAKFSIAQNWKEKKKKPCLWWRENRPRLLPDLFMHQTSNNATLLHGDVSLFSTNVIDDIPWYPISHNLLNKTSLNIYKYTWALCCYPTSDNFLSYYVPIWLSISHHYLCQCQFNFS